MNFMLSKLSSCKIALAFPKDFRRREKSSTEKKICCHYKTKKVLNYEALTKILKAKRFCGDCWSVDIGVSY